MRNLVLLEFLYKVVTYPMKEFGVKKGTWKLFFCEKSISV